MVMDASQDELYRKFIEVNFIFSLHIAISPLKLGIQVISTERRPQETPKPTGRNKVNGMTSCRDVCYNTNIYIWQLFGEVAIVHCGSAIVTMGDAVTTVTSDMTMSVRILYIDVSQSTIAQLVVAHDC